MITQEQRKRLDDMRRIKERYPTLIDYRGKYIYQNGRYRPDVRIMVNAKGTRIALHVINDRGENIIVANTKNKLLYYLLTHDMEIRD